MGKFETGVLGGFSGKVGTVVGATWRGIEYMRHKGRRTKKAPTAAQLEQRARFGMVMHFAGALNDLLFVSYAGGNGKKTGANLAVADMLANAVTGTYPAYAIDYSKVAVSKGSLQLPNGPAAANTAGGMVDYSWQDNSGIVGAAADDRAVLVVYCPETNQAVIGKGSRLRSDRSATLAVPNFTGKAVHTWLSFYNAAETEYATSMYTGSFTVV